MSRARITRTLMMLFAIMLTTVLAGAAQEKNNPPPPPPPPSKPSPAAKPAPTPAGKAASSQRTTTPTVTSSPRTTPGQRTTAIQRTVATRKTTITQRTETTRRTTTTTKTTTTTTVHNPPPPPPTPPKLSIKTVPLKDGTIAQVSRRADGGLADIHAGKMTIHSDGHGHQRIVSENNGHTVVNTGRQRGYVQSTYLSRNGRTYYQRTYVVGGRSYARVYRGYEYRGARYYGYVPVRYYSPVFYGWAYNPWVSPVYYSPAAWGWVGAPWYSAYGPFFAPYGTYPYASFWLTDYLFGATLQAAYEAVEGAPVITGVSTISAQPDQTITLIGSGFGVLPPYVGDSPYIEITDVTRDWNAGYPGDAVTLGIPERTNSQIVVQGFRGGYGQGNWYLADGDQVLVRVWNAQTGAGPAMYQLTVGQPAPQPAEAPSAQTQTELSDELKKQIKKEVQDQLEAEKDAAAASATTPSASPRSVPANEVPDALSPTERVFIVASNLDVAAESGQECNLTPGDVLMRISDDPDANQNVKASVQSSKKADCSTGLTVVIGVQDLQEMHNHFREQLDSGLQALADNGGKGGLPKAPDTATTTGEVAVPHPDPAAARQLQQQQQQAEQVEAQLVN